MQGEADAEPTFVPVRLDRAGPRRPTAARRCSPPRSARGADGMLEATPTEGQGSHLTGALAASDAFAIVPHDAGELPAGALVDALLL